jgi:peroxiredoxin
MLPLGSPRPQTRLPNTVDDSTVDLDTLAAGKRGSLVMFICNHCPYVVHVRAELVKLAHEAVERGFAVVAINSNSVASHPQDGPVHMAKLARDEGWRFPFLFDDSQEVARAYHAACTPDLFLFDAQGKLAYRGQLDDSRPGNGKPVTGRDLRAAIEAVAEGKAPSAEQKPSIGCNIKWK